MSQAATEQKKVFGLPYKQGVGVLCALIAVCLYMVYTNVFEGPPSASPTSTSTANAPAPGIGTGGALPKTQTAARGVGNRGRSEEFHPVLHPKRQEDRLPLESIDPTLKLDLLSKVQSVDLAGGQRNLFQLGPPKPVETAAAKLPGKETVIPMKPIGPVRPPDPPPPAAPPPPPPITLKFYGFSTIRVNGKMTAYFLDGENILLAAEGDTLQRRYKVVRITAKSVLMEDTESKRQQTLPLTEETVG